MAFKGTEGRAIGNEPANTRKIRTLESFIARRRRSPEYRFYLLYDKVWRADVRAYAWASAKANGAASGVDGATFAGTRRQVWEKWPRDQQSRPDASSQVPGKPVQAARTRHTTVSRRRRDRQHVSPSPHRALPSTAEGLVMKPVGEPDAGDRHVRFDERGWETERCHTPCATAPMLDSTRSTPTRSLCRADLNSGRLPSIEGVDCVPSPHRHWPPIGD
jgi:hypothetical protein